VPESHSYRSILVSHFVPEPEFFKAEIDGKFFFERKRKTYLLGGDEGDGVWFWFGGHGLSTGGHGPAVVTSTSWPHVKHRHVIDMAQTCSTTTIRDNDGSHTQAACDI